jgi:hypothetical protein
MSYVAPLSEVVAPVVTDQFASKSSTAVRSLAPNDRLLPRVLSVSYVSGRSCVYGVERRLVYDPVSYMLHYMDDTNDTHRIDSDGRRRMDGWRMRRRSPRRAVTVRFVCEHMQQVTSIGTRSLQSDSTTHCRIRRCRTCAARQIHDFDSPAGVFTVTPHSLVCMDWV